MKLSDVASRIFIDANKLTRYALNLEAEQGRDKAILFYERLGFTQENYQLLLEQIETNAMNAEAIPRQVDQYGQRYRVDILVIGVGSYQREVVRTGWIIKPGEDIARLTTLYIPKRK
jgi:filamentous hemagglutinin